MFEVSFKPHQFAAYFIEKNSLPVLTQTTFIIPFSNFGKGLSIFSLHIIVIFESCEAYSHESLSPVIGFLPAYYLFPAKTSKI